MHMTRQKLVSFFLLIIIHAKAWGDIIIINDTYGDLKIVVTHITAESTKQEADYELTSHAGLTISHDELDSDKRTSLTISWTSREDMSERRTARFDLKDAATYRLTIVDNMLHVTDEDTDPNLNSCSGLIRILIHRCCNWLGCRHPRADTKVYAYVEENTASINNEE